MEFVDLLHGEFLKIAKELFKRYSKKNFLLKKSEKNISIRFRIESATAVRLVEISYSPRGRRWGIF